MEKAAELKYGELNALQKQLDTLSDRAKGSAKMLKEEVDAEDVAEVVAKWTGVPVSKMLESEKEKLLRMEQVLGERVIGQKAAIHFVLVNG